MCDNEDISKSPFIAQILPKSNFRPDLVKCHGPGIQSHGVILGCSTEFKIDTHEAGMADLQIKVSDLVFGDQKAFQFEKKKFHFNFIHSLDSGYLR